MNPCGDLGVGYWWSIPEPQLFLSERGGQVSEAAVILREPSGPVLYRWGHAKESKHPATILPSGFVFSGAQTAQSFLHGLQVHGDIDGVGGAVDQLIGERRPPTIFLYEMFEVGAPRQSNWRGMSWIVSWHLFSSYGFIPS